MQLVGWRVGLYVTAEVVMSSCVMELEVLMSSCVMDLVRYGARKAWIAVVAWDTVNLLVTATRWYRADTMLLPHINSRKSA